MASIPFISDHIWLQDYPIRYAGCDFNARMTVIKLANGNLMLHSPCEITGEVKEEISSLGAVACIVAPGSFHYFHVESAQAAFPDAITFICPGIEVKRPNLDFDWFLGDKPPDLWAAIFDQALIRGNRFIGEIAFFHKASKTLILVDLIENFTDQTPNANWFIKLWFKWIFRISDNPKSAPEYQMGWKDKEAARMSLEKILDWDFERIILAHGDLIDASAKEIALKARRNPLRTP